MMASDRIRVVIPMKPLEASKRRLVTHLEPRVRALLSLWMLEQAALAARGAVTTAKVVVIGGDASVTALCAELGVGWQPDPIGDLNRALDCVRRDSAERGWTSMLFLAGDLPCITSADVAGLAAALERLDLVLAPGARGGTNAIHVRSGIEFDFQLGPESFSRHRGQADRLGLTWRTFEHARIMADVDTVADLEWLERTFPDLWRLVARMERFLRPLPT